MTKCVKTEVECMAVCYVHRKEAIVTAALPFPERNEIDFWTSEHWEVGKEWWAESFTSTQG